MSDDQSKKGDPSLSPYVYDAIPRTDICKAALDLAWRELPEPIFNHCVRTFLIAQWFSRKEGSEWSDATKLPLLFVACICHDLGASDAYNGSQRFEVEGADAANKHLLSHGISEIDSHKVWVAIALHTSQGIAERIDPLSRLLRLGVVMDFSRAKRDAMGVAEYCAEIELHLPRLQVEKALGDAIVNQAPKSQEQPESIRWQTSEKHPKASWPGILLRAHLENPGYEGVNPAF